MTKPKGENELPPVFYGRRKSDPKPVTFPPVGGQWKLLNRETVLVILVLFSVCLVAWFLGARKANAAEPDYIVRSTWSYEQKWFPVMFDSMQAEAPYDWNTGKRDYSKKEPFVGRWKIQFATREEAEKFIKAVSPKDRKQFNVKMEISK